MHVLEKQFLNYIFNSERLRASGSGSSSERGKDNASPFVHVTHGNPAFTPQKVGKGGVTVSF